MMLAEKTERKLLAQYVDAAMEVASPELQAALKEWKDKHG